MQWGTASQKQLYLRREEDKSKNATKVDKGREEKTTLAGRPKGTAEPGGDEPAGQYVRSAGVEWLER
ncbi:hypothetical protein [Petroclostridium xylanilyticum]|uniref:hypothetical protein n=1 Tax=Petroclostridium xylanilyticum TaxID=1792311 RepID=UPI000B982496|nr:hypothetical protein [Petroclostridium xylanilyticum]